MDKDTANVRKAQGFLSHSSGFVLFQLEQGLNFRVQADVILIPDLDLDRN